jgi:DNA-binding transcriptional LysR family regulator
MELRHLRYFVAVAEELHFGRAARRLYISQPPLSRQIRVLEQDLGVALFRRNRRNVSLTVAGAGFLNDARDTLARLERAKLVAQAVSKQDAALAVGCSTSFEPATIRGFEAAFRERFPGMRLRLHSDFTMGLVEGLREGWLDVGFLALPIDAQDLSVYLIRREPFSMALRKNHHLARGRWVTLAALRDEPLVWFQRKKNPPFYDYHLSVFRRAGFRGQVLDDADDRSAALSLVAQGCGFAFVSQSLTAIRRRGVVYRRLGPPSPLLEIAVACRHANPPPRALAFVEMVRELTNGRARDMSLSRTVR